MARRNAWLVLVALALSASGCSLFAPRPRPLPRRPHVVLVGIGGLTPGQVSPTGTPHLYRVQHDGAYAWELHSKNPGDRVAVYCEALTGLPRSLHATKSDMARHSLVARCRDRGLTAISLLRTPQLACFDPEAEVVSRRGGARGPSLDHPVAVGAYAAELFACRRPALLLVELSPGGEDPRDCDAGLGKIVGAIRRAGVAGRTTLILMGTRPGRSCWLVRGPDTRHGHEIADQVEAADTVATASRLLGVHAPDGRGRVVTDAFRAWSRSPKTPGERTVPRGSVRGVVRRPDGQPLARASVLLVRNEPPDGIQERWADCTTAGEFAFDSVPAGTYDYVFVFDNLPCRLRRSLLVARDFVVKRDATVRPELEFRRLGGDGPGGPPLPPVEHPAAFLTDEQVERLVATARRARPVWPGAEPTVPPVLAADALTGRRVRTRLVRTWLLDACRKLRETTTGGEADEAMIRDVIDLAAAYDLNRASGLLTRHEALALRSVLGDAAARIRRAARRTELPEHANAYTALALAGAVLGPSPAAERMSETARDLFDARFRTLREEAEQNPYRVAPAELCSVVEYALINEATDCGNYLDDELRRLVRLAAWSLTPEQRQVGQSGGRPAGELGFLGLAKTAFADDEFGGTLRALWETCGTPFWTPRGDESVLGVLLSAAAMPAPRPRRRVRSEQLTGTTAVLTHHWGGAAEWFVHVSGWNIDVHVRAANLARTRTDLAAGEILSRPEVVAFERSPACDYLLLRGRVGRRAAEKKRAYRHVLFNKLTGYLVVWDSLPAGFRSQTRAIASGSARSGVLVGRTGVEAQVLSLAVTAAARRRQMVLRSASSSPAWAIYPPPSGKGPAELEPWSVDVISLAPVEAGGFHGRHLKLTADRGPEFIRLARQPALANGNFEDVILSGRVGVIRRGPKSEDVILVRAETGTTGSRVFRLERGSGFVTIYRTGRAEGWSDGRSREVRVRLGEAAPRRPTLEVDGRPRRASVEDRDVVFDLSSGAHTFSIRR
ncbi:MAG: carboxypeptidase-like regulatory domain-containing protein [Planctomycetota bacterium]